MSSPNKYIFSHHWPTPVDYTALYTSDTYGLLKKLIDEQNQNVIHYRQYCTDMGCCFPLLFLPSKQVHMDIHELSVFWCVNLKDDSWRLRITVDVEFTRFLTAKNYGRCWIYFCVIVLCFKRRWANGMTHQIPKYILVFLWASQRNNDSRVIQLMF